MHLAKLDPTPAEVHVLADRGRAREMLGTIEELVRAGHVDGVLVLRVSCLARDFQSLELFVELCDVHGVHVASCDGFDIRNRVLCATYYAFLEREREEHARAGRRGWELRRREPRS
ncbi:MAG: hypothetical protein QOC78_1770 [Solirubrobacteraceae bacterium]|nr:hypothetical protein [Solirubrobacteraceae bacterium]